MKTLLITLGVFFTGLTFAQTQDKIIAETNELPGGYGLICDYDQVNPRWLEGDEIALFYTDSIAELFKNRAVKVGLLFHYSLNANITVLITFETQDEGKQSREEAYLRTYDKNWKPIASQRLAYVFKNYGMVVQLSFGQVEFDKFARFNYNYTGSVNPEDYIQKRKEMSSGYFRIGEDGSISDK